MKDPRFDILVENLRKLGLPPTSLQECLAEVAKCPEERRASELVAVLRSRGLLAESQAQELDLALEFSGEAAGVFFRAHLQRKPVVLLLKGLEEVLKTGGVEMPTGVPTAAGAVLSAPVPEDGLAASDGRASPCEAMVAPAGSVPSPRGVEPPAVSGESGAGPAPRVPAAEPSPAEGAERVESPPAETPAERRPSASRKSPKASPPYEIIRRLGQGRMTQTFKARDRTSGDSVVLKFFPPNWDQKRPFVEKLFGISRQAMSFLHPNVARLRQIVMAHEECYAVCEYVDGTPLRELLVSGEPLPVQRALNLLDQVLDGTAVAHEHGLYHGSLHPGNIVVEGTGSVKVLDLGFGMLDEGASDSKWPQEARVYHAHFQAPERQLTAVPPDPQSDIYELGIVLYLLLAGRPPFASTRVKDLAERHRSEPLPPLPAEAGPYPERLVELLNRMTAKVPVSRPVSIRSVLDEVRAIKADLLSRPASPRLEPGPVEAKPTGAVEAKSPPKESPPPPAPVPVPHAPAPPKPLLGGPRRSWKSRTPTPGNPVVTAVTFGILLLGSYLAYAYMQRDIFSAHERDLAELGRNLSVRGNLDGDVAAKIVAKGDRAILMLRDMLDKGNPAGQVPAILTLVQMDSPAARQAILDYLNHPNPRVRAEVILAVGRSRRPDALPILTEALQDPDPFIRCQCILALGQHGGQSAVRLVSRGLRDRDPSVVHQARLTLNRLDALTPGRPSETDGPE